MPKTVKSEVGLMSRWVLALAVVVLVGCGEDGNGGGTEETGPIQVTLETCNEAALSMEVLSLHGEGYECTEYISGAGVVDCALCFTNTEPEQTVMSRIVRQGDKVDPPCEGARPCDGGLPCDVEIDRSPRVDLTENPCESGDPINGD